MTARPLLLCLLAMARGGDAGSDKKTPGSCAELISTKTGNGTSLTDTNDADRRDYC